MKNGKKSGAKVARKPLKLNVTATAAERKVAPMSGSGIPSDALTRKCVG